MIKLKCTLCQGDCRYTYNIQYKDNIIDVNYMIVYNTYTWRLQWQK